MAVVEATSRAQVSTEQVIANATQKVGRAWGQVILFNESFAESHRLFSVFFMKNTKEDTHAQISLLYAMIFPVETAA